MTFSAWKLRVLSYLDVDATRRGIESLRDGFLRAVIADLKHFVPKFADNKTSYADGDSVPFGEKAAEAAAMYMKARIVRATEKDLSLVASYQRDYETIRRLLVRDSNEETEGEWDIKAILGNTLPFSLTMEVNEAGEAWVDFTGYKLWFTINGCGGTEVVAMDSSASGGIIASGFGAYWEISHADVSAKFVAGDYDYLLVLENISAGRKTNLRKGIISFS